MARTAKLLSLMALFCVAVVSGRRILDETAVNPGKLRTILVLGKQPYEEHWYGRD